MSDIAQAFQRATSEPLEIFSALREFCLRDPQTGALETITPFIGARKLSGHPIDAYILEE